MIAVAIQINSNLQETIEKSRCFTLHLLGEEHIDRVEKFAKRSEITETQINGLPYVIDENHQVILQHSIGYLTCNVVHSIGTGDHILYIGELIKEQLMKDRKPICTLHTELQYA